MLGPEIDSNDNSLVVECKVDRDILDAKPSEESRDLIELYTDALLED